MPDVNLGVAVTTRAVLSAAAGAAVDKGKASVVVDTARAAAAIAAGATVVVVNVPPSTDPKKDINYSVNDTGGTEQFLPRLVAGYAYSQRLATGVAVSVANAQEWRGDAYRTGTGANAGVLEALGTSGDFQALRQGAANQPGPGTPLNDGSVAYWGAWLSAPGASATVSAGGVPASAPALGRFDYVFGNATAQMPGTGTATYTAVPGAGSLGVNAGSIQVNFVQREVAVQNLGFSLDGLAFSGMNGVARYDNTTVGSGSAAGTFAARYTSGQCAGCSAFAPTASSFNGSFIGRNADGLVFSSILITGNPGGSTSAGVQLLTRPPP